MQLATKIRSLHLLIAEAIEKIYINNLSDRYPDLAFHYAQARKKDKTLYYLQKAGDYARSNYQNQKALEYYYQLLNYNSLEDDDRIKVLLKVSKILTLVGEWDKCALKLQEASTLAIQLDKSSLIARVNNSLGYLLMLKGAYTPAEEYINASINAFEYLNETKGIARSFGDLGNLYFRQGKYDEAKTYFLKSIELNRSAGLRTDSQIYANLGLTYMNQGDYEEGIHHQLEALAEAQNYNDKSGMATLHTNLGIVYFESGQYDLALDQYQKGLKLSEELGNKQLTAIAIGCIGSVYQRKGDYEKAMDNFIRDLALCEELGDKQGTAIALGLIGELRSIEGEFDVAVEYLSQNLLLCEELGYQKGIAKALNTLGDVYTSQGVYEKAIEHYKRAIDVSRSINNRLVLGYSLVELANAYILEGSYKEAQTLHLEASTIAESLGNPDLIFEATILEAQVNYYSGNTGVAHEILTTLAAQARNTTEIAAVQYELYQISPNEVHKQKALALYRKLYDQEPKFIFQKRISDLQ
jgi:tetratricopeptide (TPR) repeat protein